MKQNFSFMVILWLLTFAFHQHERHAAPHRHQRRQFLQTILSRVLAVAMNEFP